ncbi:thioesterase domain-containing protein [Staphylococcus saprophyticus]
MFLHPGGGGVFCYTDLINNLESDYNILGIQCPGIDNDDEPYWNLNELTDLYIQALESHLDEKSNIFIGWSSGGSFAHKLINKLSSNTNITIEKLILIDTLADYPNKIEIENHENYEKNVWRLFCESKNVNFKNFDSMKIEDIIHSMNDNAYKIGVLDKKIDRSLAEKELKVSVANFNILRSQNFDLLIDAPIYWIISEDHLYNGTGFREYHESLWRKRTNSFFYTLSSPGTHKNMVFPPC